MKPTKLTLLLTAFLSFSTFAKADAPSSSAEGRAGSVIATSPVEAASGVITRVFGTTVAGRFTFEKLPATGSGRDAYEYESVGGRVTVRGTSPVAMARGAYSYIKDNGLGMATRSGAWIVPGRPWPDAPKTRIETPFKFRHHYNVVSFGYQCPYYTRADWERELDWLALHGYDMPMAPVATEAIASRVWEKLGLTPAETVDFAVGPAHAPWFRMGNIRNVDVPVPPEWNRDQVALQHFLLGRMRELGMTPVIQSFAGFVPDAVKRIAPDVALHDTSWNGGFGKNRRPRTIMPDTALFAKITRLYMEEYMREFGPQKYWLVDSFNEMQLPKTGKSKEELLAGYGEDTYRAISAAKPDAVWVIQGWMFGYQSYIWSKSAVRALLSKVPDDRMLVLDYANDYATNWPKFEGFFGKKWAYGFVPNMGGKTAYTGRLDLYAKGAAEMLKSPKRGDIAGFTASGEGMENNEVIYELLGDVPWTKDAAAVNLDAWLPAYSKAKYGACPDAMVEAWKLLRASSYSRLTPHPSFSWQTLGRGHGSTDRSPAFLAAAEKFLACAPALQASPLYRADALEIAALALGTKAEDWFAAAFACLDAGDMPTADHCEARAQALLLEADRLLESHPLHRLERWIGMARAHGDTTALKDYYEANAKRIITVWGPPVNDYACRVYAGLIRDFYAPRMHALYAGARSGAGFVRGPWEEKWVKTPGVSAIAPYADPVGEAARLLSEAVAGKIPETPKTKYLTIGEWSPASIDATKWTDLEFVVPQEHIRHLRRVKFVYKSGSHALDIRKVALVADGREVAADSHDGVAGKPSSRETYTLKLPAGATTNNGCVIRAGVRGKGGADSRGEVRLLVAE